MSKSYRYDDEDNLVETTAELGLPRKCFDELRHPVEYLLRAVNAAIEALPDDPEVDAALISIVRAGGKISAFLDREIEAGRIQVKG